MAVCGPGRSEGGDLDGRVPDGGDVRRAAGGHRGGDQPGRGHLRGVEEGHERQPHRLPGVRTPLLPLLMLMLPLLMLPLLMLMLPLLMLPLRCIAT